MTMLQTNLKTEFLLDEVKTYRIQRDGANTVIKFGFISKSHAGVLGITGILVIVLALLFRGPGIPIFLNVSIPLIYFGGVYAFLSYQKRFRDVSWRVTECRIFVRTKEIAMELERPKIVCVNTHTSWDGGHSQEGES